ncbi:regulatory protein RecX [Corynebacterium anserum]|uniref:Regulatory protein RecX n=1 Tax=Corynebacterium anserum TaxID=2684406 RepID=A0A7G7YNQ8_9CORY|nr:regulatory protein RecX [Corynebacterium anserum]MBC2681717.1 recombination regulator RecX [Corynebacterium anserum]QNH96128.1 recombination regulator RecX [Corynebacterium anserum]
MTTNSSLDKKISQLKEALREWESQETPSLIDVDEERALAPVKAKAIRLLNHRDRSAYELRSRLLEAEFDSDLVDAVVERCVANGMVDDSRFAVEWMRQRHKNQKKSAAVLRHELQAKGVASEIIDDALKDITAEDNAAVLAALVNKKAQSVKTVPETRAEYDKYLRRILGVAARRGFPQAQSFAAAQRALNHRIDELKG